MSYRAILAVKRNISTNVKRVLERGRILTAPVLQNSHFTHQLCLDGRICIHIYLIILNYIITITKNRSNDLILTIIARYATYITLYDLTV